MAIIYTIRLIFSKVANPNDVFVSHIPCQITIFCAAYLLYAHSTSDTQQEETAERVPS